MLSIRSRLTLSYTLTAFTLITATALFLYWETTNILYRADYQFIKDEAETIQYIINKKTDALRELQEEMVDIPSRAHGSMYHYYIRLLDENNTHLIETPNMDKIAPTNDFNKSSALLGKKNYLWYTHGNTKYIIYQAPIMFPQNKIGVMQMALDVSYQHAIMSDRKELIFCLLIGALCALGVGFLIAHRGMRSLYILTDTTKKISVDSLDKRIDSKSWPKELRVLGEAFNQMLARIEEAFLKLKQFSADLAHELRTPLNTLISSTEITLSRDYTLTEYRDLLSSNLEELQRIAKVMENILFLARAENPHIQLQKQLINVHEEVTHLIEFYQILAEEKQINLTLTGEANLFVDAIMFRRLMGNLLSNAIKYTPQNGKIMIVINDDKTTVFIKIEDTGIGIAPPHIPKIFDRFYRVDDARNTNTGGTGLGLAIAKSIVELHGGNITLQSRVGKGTSVLLCFPK